MLVSGHRANGFYYPCFQAAIHALSAAGLPYQGHRGTLSHERVQAEFAGQLINRRKVYPSGLRDVLPRNLALRHQADYDQDHVSEIRANRALGRARSFVEAVASEEGSV